MQTADMTRRNLWTSIAVLGASGSPAAFSQDLEPKPQLKPDLVKEYVSKSHGNLPDVRELSKREPMLVRAAWDQGAGDWETGLGAASHMGNRDIAKFLIDGGARIDAFAVFMLGELGPAKALLAAFPEIHKTPGPHGISLLSHAIVGRQQSFQAFEMLIKAGADVNAAAWRGTTPLIQAVAVEEPEMVKALLANGADPARKLPNGMTALDLARKKNAAAIIEMLAKV